MENAGRDQVQHIFLVANFNGMSCVVAALVSDDNIDIAGQHIDYLSLPFIAPLGAYQHSVWHFPVLPFASFLVIPVPDGFVVGRDCVPARRHAVSAYSN